MVNSGKLAVFATLVAALLTACTRTTSIQQVLDPTLQPEQAAVADDREDASSSTALTMRRDGERIFLDTPSLAGPE